jgi:hypothetical protein
MTITGCRSVMPANIKLRVSHRPLHRAVHKYPPPLLSKVSLHPSTASTLIRPSSTPKVVSWSCVSDHDSHCPLCYPQMQEGVPYCCVFTVPFKLAGATGKLVSTKDGLKHWKIWIHDVSTGHDWFYELEKTDEADKQRAMLSVEWGWPISIATQNTIREHGSFIGITLFSIERIRREGMFRRKFATQVLILPCFQPKKLQQTSANTK